MNSSVRGRCMEKTQGHQDGEWPTVAIIILNWNGWKDTIECLESLYQIKYQNYYVILVDNDSEDDSVEKIKEYAEGKIKVISDFFAYSKDNKPIKIIEYTREEAAIAREINREIYNLYLNKIIMIIKNEKNYGFAEGNNIGIRYALSAINPKYILLLNNDTVVDQNFLIELVKVAESDERIGIMNPEIRFYTKPDKIQFIGGNIDWLGLSFKKQEREAENAITSKGRIINTERASGACMLIKTNIIRSIGGLSAEYFFQCEDTDYCIRASKCKWKIVCTRDSIIWHKVSVSLNKVSENKIRYFIRNSFILRSKYASGHKLILFALIFIFIKAPLMMAYYSIYFRNIELIRGISLGLKEGLEYIAVNRVNRNN